MESDRFLGRLALLAPDLPDGPGKECSACGLWKALHDFARQVDGPQGRRSHCRVCDRERDRQRWERQTGRARYWRRDARRLTYVYRFLDAHGALLYVGQTYDLLGRFYRGPHAHDRKEWWPEVARVVVEAYGTADEAETAEWHAIEEEAPRHNARGGVLRLAERPAPLDRWAGDLVDLALQYPSSRL